MHPIFVDLLPGLLGWAVKATVLLLFAWAATGLMRNRSASLRHLVWGVAIAGVLVLPVAGTVAPTWAAPGLPDIAPRGAVRPLAPDRPATPQGEAIALERAAPLSMAALPGVDAPVNAPVVSEAAAAGTREAPARWTAWLVPLWLAGFGTVLFGMLAGLAGTALIERRARPATDGRLLDLWAAARRRLGLTRPVRLLSSDDHGMPMTWGARRPVVLLPAAASTWPSERVWTVLLHELAHVRRHDFLTQLVARAACAVHWFNPLAWLAARRLREEREHACDDVVLACGARASDYADHLLAIARSLRAARLSAVAAIAMARPSQLSNRLLAVLDARRPHAGVGRKSVVGAMAAAAVLILPLAGAAAPGDRQDSLKFVSTKVGEVPAPEDRAPTAKPRGDSTGHAEVGVEQPPRITAAPLASLCDWSRRGEQHNGSSMNVDDDHAKITIVADDCTLDVEYRGEIRYTEDDRDIAAISRGGYFLIEERVGRERRELEIRAVGNGALERKWFVNREERPYGPEAATWLSEILPFMFRRTGINAEARATRVLDRRGPEGLLQEITLIPSDFVARKYYEVLLSRPNLPTDLVRRVVRDAGQRIDSDHELGRLLQTVAEKQQMDETVRIAYVEAAGSIESDHQHGQVLRAILDRRNLTPELAAAMLRSAKNIDSDHEVGRVLQEFLAAHPLDEALSQAFFEAFENIESDHQQRQVLSTALERGAPSRVLLDRVLGYASEIESSHERGRLLRQVVELYPLDGALPASYLTAARGIESDHELGSVLRSLVERDELSDATVTSVLEAATAIDSDHELGRLLILLVEKGKVRDATRPAFMRALDTIESEHTRGQVLAKLYPRGRPAE